jgi:Tfp pilus assembly protein PilZ
MAFNCMQIKTAKRYHMSAQEKKVKKYNVAISKLFQIIIELDEEQQMELLSHAEQLLVKEKRGDSRISCDIPINYAANDHVYANKITNISANGLFIDTRGPLIRGDEIIMAFKLEGLNRSLKLRGEIARANQAGIGVAFKNNSSHLEEMIRAIVNRMK